MSFCCRLVMENDNIAHFSFVLSWTAKKVVAWHVWVNLAFASLICNFSLFSFRQGKDTVMNECVGHLLRTKSSEVSEGGLATGISVADSPLLLWEVHSYLLGVPQKEVDISPSRLQMVSNGVLLSKKHWSTKFNH